MNSSRLLSTGARSIEPEAIVSAATFGVGAMTNIQYLLPGVIIVALACGTLLGGCGTGNADLYAEHNLGAAREIVETCIESSGGLRAWRKVRCIQANAVIATYNDRGQAYVNRLRVSIQIDGKITATARTARGQWRATMEEQVLTDFETSGFRADPAMKARVSSTLAILARRLPGPLNLLSGKLIGDVDRVIVEGTDMVRVRVADEDASSPAAYYFDAADASLLFVTEGGDSPGSDGAITKYAYTIIPNGLVFPKSIRVVRMGEHMLLGGIPVLEASFSDVTVRSKFLGFR